MSGGGRQIGESGSLLFESGTSLRLYRAIGEDAEKVEVFLLGLGGVDRMNLLQSLHLQLEDLGNELKNQVAEGSGFSLLVEGGEEEGVLAFASCRLMPGLKDTAWVGVAVSGSRRREGMATKLLERISRIAAQHGIQRMVGFADSGKDAVKALLHSACFNPDIREDDDGVRFLISSRCEAPVETESGGEGRENSLRYLFEARSVAVIGASRDQKSLGHRIVVNLVSGGFEGPVFPVNPTAEHICSIRAMASIRDLDGRVDLAIVIVPAEKIPQIIDECAAAGVKALIVISAYFSEVGEEGQKREQRLAEQVRGHGMRMLGPNSTGLINTSSERCLNASFCEIMPAAGAAALCSQSGALGMAITAMAEGLDLGLSTMVNVGNRADITVNDLLEYWEEDERTRVILFYLESFGDPRRFARVARRVGRSRPIVVVRGGYSRAGRRIETVSESTFDANNVAIEAMMRQTGIIRAQNLDEMFDIGRTLTTQALPTGARVAIMTNAGGAGILAADALENAGLEIVSLGLETRSALEEILPHEALARNPVDMLAACQAASYEAAVALLLDAEEVDNLVVLYTPLGMADTEQIAQAILRGVCNSRDRQGTPSKPVLVSIVGEDQRRTISGGPLDETLPVYAFPEITGRVLGKILGYSRWHFRETGVFPEFPGQRLAEVRKGCAEILRDSGPGWVGYLEMLELFKLAQLPLPDGRVVRTMKDAQSAAGELGFPLVLRLHSSLMEHRLEEGGIRLNLKTMKELREAFSAMKRDFASNLRQEGDGVLILQRLVKDATELRLSARDDRRFGPLVSIGLGGIHLEALSDRVFRVSPLTDLDAAEMFRELRGRKLLEGYRGHPAADIEALEGLLLRLSSLVEALPEISAVDLDPVMALRPGEGFVLLDARLRLQRIRAA